MGNDNAESGIGTATPPKDQVCYFIVLMNRFEEIKICTIHIDVCSSIRKLGANRKSSPNSEQSIVCPQRRKIENDKKMS